jgi:hypothetical protein
MLYSTPACMVNVIVPDGTAQVGCITEATVGIAGALGIALIVTVEPAGVEQVLSAILLTLRVYVAGANAANTSLTW